MFKKSNGPSILGTVDESFWTSASKLGDTVYYWLTTGKKLQFNDWSAGQPNHYYSSTNCILLCHSDDLKWKNVDCTDVYRVMCERSASH